MKCLSGAALKWIALCTMMIDHTAFVFKEEIYTIPNGDALYLSMRLIGRVAFPIFAFLLVEGFLHTKHMSRYLRDLLLFALVSEIPADFAFYNEMTLEWSNVFFTLALGLAMLICIDRINQSGYLFWLLSACLLVLFSSISWFIKTDYSIVGILLIYVYYVFRKDRLFWFVGTFACFVASPTRMISYPFLLLYNGKRGKQPKYLFYLFYPLHLGLLYIIKRCLKGVI